MSDTSQLDEMVRAFDRNSVARGSTCLDPERRESTELPPVEVIPFDAEAKADAEFAGVIARWQEVFDGDPDAHITQHPEYVLEELKAEALRAENESKKRLLSCGVLIAFGWRGWAGLAILVPKVLRLPLVPKLGPAWQLTGWRLAGNRFLGDPSGSVQVALLQEAARYVGHSNRHMLLIEDLDEQTELWRAVQSVDQRRTRVVLPVPFQERHRIRFPEEPDDYWKSFSSKTRNKFRRRLRKIGPIELLRVTETEQVADFLRQAHQVSLHTWQTQQLGLRVRNDEREHRLLTRLARLGALRSYLLRRDGQPIAFLIGTQFNGRFDYEEVGYDRRFADYSPGQVLLLKVLEDLQAERPPEWFDFGGGDASYKRLFATHSSKSGNVWLMPSTFRTSVTMGILKAQDTARRGLRAALAGTGLLTKVRQWIRRGRWRRH
ncbi:MAG: GNAT family N-acetyltransferase [Planctomycetes bacterium]|nr:GNAT family N-acetyltransferase [Planctomycetota bacterium]